MRQYIDDRQRGGNHIKLFDFLDKSVEQWQKKLIIFGIFDFYKNTTVEQYFHKLKIVRIK